MTLYLFQIHTLQGGIHAFHHTSHGFGDLWNETPSQRGKKLNKARTHQLVTDRGTRCTWFIVTAVWTLAATASTRALILRKLTDWFFCRMAFSAWILATSIFPFWIACIEHSVSVKAPPSDGLSRRVFLMAVLLFWPWPSLVFLLCHISWSFFGVLWQQTSNWRDFLKWDVKEEQVPKQKQAVLDDQCAAGRESSDSTHEAMNNENEFSSDI